MSQSLKLGIVNGETRLSKFRIAPNQQLLIGKAKTNDIVIDNSHVSGQHAQLLMDETGVLHIVDVGSTNGTYVNGQKLTVGSPFQITGQDKIVLTKSQNIRLVFNPDAHVFKVKSPKPNGGGREIFQDTDLISLLRNKSVITIGRTDQCDLQIAHPTISRLHATIEKRSNGKYVITDKGSMNGTFVNGHRVKGKAQVSEKDLIFIGRFKISFRGIAQDISKSLTISATNIEKTYPNGFVGLKKASFTIASSSLLAVMGPSGCGKSTLLKALCGDSPATSGEVKLFDLELKSNYDYLKTQIGYVPQDDIVHRQLTVQQSLYYAAKLRLPSAKDAQIEAKIKSVLQQLNIEFIKDNLVGKISGGQRKRVSIAVELLTDPMILFLDEPTSPLDPQTIEEFLGILRKLADNGTTVIMVTHKPDDLEFMDSVMFMSAGGHLVYDDSVHNYLSYFGVSKTREVYQELDQNSKKWIDKRNSQRGAESKRIVSTPPVKNVGSIDFMHQFFWLSRRYLSIKLNDKMNTAVMIGQAPIIAMLVCIIFVNITQAVPFLMAISAVWFGANNAAREIVSELPIYKRERMFNQGILPYIFSKLFVLGGFAAIQSLLFIGIVSVFYSNATPPDVEWFNPLSSFLWMLFISIAASMMGLLISALVDTAEKVMTIVPIALIPQIMLAGLVAKISSGFVEFLSYFTLSRWGTEGFSIIQKEVMVGKMEMKEGTGVFADDNPQKFIEPEMIKSDQDTVANAVDNIKGQFHESYDNFGDLQSTLTLDFLAIGFLTLVFFVGIYLALKSKDPIKIN